MKKLIVLAAVLLAGVAQAEEKKSELPSAPSPAQLSPEALENALYSTGLSISKSLEPFNLTAKELESVIKGIKDGVAGKPKYELDEMKNKAVQQLVQGRLALAAEKEKTKGQEYLRKASAEKGAVKTSSGLVITQLKEGSGASPGPTDKVKVHYVGTLTGGKEFDSSVKRGQPLEFQLNQVVPCWTEGLGLMKTGGKAKLVCPPEIAYGPQGRPPTIPGNAVLVFEVELLGFEAVTTPPAAPPVSPAQGK